MLMVFYVDIIHASVLRGIFGKMHLGKSIDMTMMMMIGSENGFITKSSELFNIILIKYQLLVKSMSLGIEKGCESG